MTVELEPVALAPASRRERRRAGSPRPQPGRKVAQRRRGRRLGVLVAAAVILAGVGRLTGVGPAGSLHRDEAELPVTFAQDGGAGIASPPPGKPLSPGWRLVRRAPITSRHQTLSTWTGRELLIWGGMAGGQPLADGAAYYPDTDQWRTLPAAPLQAREGATSVWTGREWIIWGGFVRGKMSGEGAAYEPGVGSWRVLPPAPITPRAGTVGVWTGREVLIWGEEGRGPAGGAAYDPDRDRWRTLPRGGPVHEIGGGAWTGREMVVWSYGGFAAFDPDTNRWRALPPAPFSPWFTNTAVWTGTDLLVVGGSDETGQVPGGAAYDPAGDRWRTLTAAPDPVDISEASATWTGRLLVLARGPSRVQVHDPAEDTWDVMPGLSEGPRVGSVAAWTGDEMVFWGGYGVLGSAAVPEEGVAWRPCARGPGVRPGVGRGRGGGRRSTGGR